MKKVLMHVCCAPCFITIQEDIEKNGMLINDKREKVDLTAYWYNPNIHPKVEYDRRKESFIKFCDMRNVKNIICDEYDLNGFVKEVVENVGEGKKWEIRCKYCYYRRLENVFKYASENGYDIVSTTLTRSPFQNHDVINSVAENLAKKYNVEYVYSDYRHTYYEGQKKAREYGIYMQKYCGCIFSENTTNIDDKPSFPNDFKFLPVKRDIVIKKEKNNKEQYMDLLLEADPSREMVEEYLFKGDLFVLTYKDEPVCIAVIIKIDNDTVELKNIATKEEYRGKGYGNKMLKYLADNYKQKYKKIIVGTTENNIPFYVKQGFDKYEKTIKNFFVDNYNEEIWDGDMQCIDMYYYSKYLKKK